MIALLAPACLALVLVAGTPPAAMVGLGHAVDQPWERSVQLEKDGDLRGAEAVLVAAWGKKPDNFYAQLRLAYLALVGKRANAAVARYARARRFPEGAADADATAGYAAALALKGWQLADAGRVGEARATWQKALAVEPEQPDARAGIEKVHVRLTEPELWGAVVGQTFGVGQYQGLAVFGQIPWRLLDRLTLRAAGRYIAWREVTRPRAWAFSETSPARWTVGEIYGAVGYDTSALTAEALGFGIATAGSPTIAGAGLRLRVGRSAGASADLAVLRHAGRFANQQVRPVAFLVLAEDFVLHAGGRFTREDGGSWLSAVAGAAFVGNPFGVYLQGHHGTEHWAANLVSPALLSITPRTRSGGSLTVLWDATRLLRVAGQAEAYTLAADGATGAFWSVSLGLQLRIGSV
jgi:hypothetical protein